jgi:hypothetical protein
MENIQAQDLNTKLSAIDKALAQAKARKAAKDSSPPPAGDDVQTFTIQKTDDNKALKLAEREARRAQIAKDREERKAAKAAAQPKGPAHMKKIASAANKLPTLTDTAQLLFNEATTNFSAEQLTALALHIQHFNRVKATERALNQRVVQGTQVRIIGGDPKFIGMTGSVTKAQRIRCYVTVPGVKREVYCFTSDIEVLEATQALTGTDD